MSRTRCQHWSEAPEGAIYVGPGPDPRTGRRLSSARWGRPPGDPARMFGWLLRHPWVAHRAVAELGGQALCCQRRGPCYGDVLAALSRGETVHAVLADWRRAGLLGPHAGLFEEAS